MNSRERMLAALNHEEADRIPITDYLWTATVERWHQEGIPEDVTPAEYFGFENADRIGRPVPTKRVGADELGQEIAPVDRRRTNWAHFHQPHIDASLCQLPRRLASRQPAAYHQHRAAAHQAGLSLPGRGARNRE